MGIAKVDAGRQFFLGVDGGGTKTTAVVVDAEGRERGRALAGCANARVLGIERAAARAAAVARVAATRAGATLPLSGAWIGLAGLDSLEDCASLMPHLQGMGTVMRVTNDAELLLSALGTDPGVALVAGTGSIALGQDSHGHIVRAGGWGEILGDEGSGYDIGRQALRAAVRWADRRGPRTILLERILQHWGLQMPNDLIGRVHHAQDRVLIAELAPLVLAAERERDRAASAITRRAARELALAALAVDRALAVPDDGMRLVFGGGLLINEARLRELLVAHIRRHRSVAVPLIAAEPALDAARAAREEGALTRAEPGMTELALAHALPSAISVRR
jgi:glucosamine kinase